MKASAADFEPKIDVSSSIRVGNNYSLTLIVRRTLDCRRGIYPSPGVWTFYVDIQINA